MRIVVLGYIVRAPLGAMCWHHFQYVLGLKKLGHEVLFLEDSDKFHFYNPETYEYTIDPTYGLVFTDNLFKRYNLQNNWAYYNMHTDNWHGLSKSKVFSFCSGADVVFNLSAVNPLRDWWSKIPCRVFLDTDCGFTQIRMTNEPELLDLAKNHTCHFSLGENIGQDDCKVPLLGFKWNTTRQPVYLDAWKVSRVDSAGKWTTIMQWDSYEEVEYENEKYGMKSAAFKDYFSLPKEMPAENFELGVGTCTTETTETLKADGWSVINPLIPTKTPWTYQQYIADSFGEWSVAKHGFVVSRCGYLSERSLNYMASGKPVVVQDTGFSKFFPTGAGLLCFSSLEEACEGIMNVRNNYSMHCNMARQIVEEYADSAVVLGKLLKDIY